MIKELQTVPNPLEWQFLITAKGTQRAKSLCKAAGLVVKVEVDLQSGKNKLTLDLYDKELMPVVSDLYIAQDQSFSMLKNEDNQAFNTVFDPFISQVESCFKEIMESEPTNLKLDDSKILVGDITHYEIV